MRLWPRRNPKCWWCRGRGQWQPVTHDNQMGWAEDHEMVECSECDGTGDASWVRAAEVSR